MVACGCTVTDGKVTRWRISFLLIANYSSTTVALRDLLPTDCSSSRSKIQGPACDETHGTGISLAASFLQRPRSLGLADAHWNVRSGPSEECVQLDRLTSQPGELSEQALLQMRVATKR
jgi:hypothetical protein